MRPRGRSFLLSLALLHSVFSPDLIFLHLWVVWKRLQLHSSRSLFVFNPKDQQKLISALKSLIPVPGRGTKDSAQMSYLRSATPSTPGSHWKHIINGAQVKWLVPHEDPQLILWEQCPLPWVPIAFYLPLFHGTYCFLLCVNIAVIKILSTIPHIHKLLIHLYVLNKWNWNFMSINIWNHDNLQINQFPRKLTWTGFLFCLTVLSWLNIKFNQLINWTNWIECILHTKHCLCYAEATVHKSKGLLNSLRLVAKTINSLQTRLYSGC